MSIVRFLALLVLCTFGLFTPAHAQCGILLQDEVPPSDGSGHRTLFEWDFDGPGPLEPELLTGADGGRVMAFNGTRWRQVGARLTGQMWFSETSDPIVFQFLDFRGELHAIASSRTTGGNSGLFRWDGNAWNLIPLRGVGCGTSGVTGWMGSGTVWYDRIVIVGQYLTCASRRTLELTWDGTSWAALAPEPTQFHIPLSTSVFATSDGRLLMGGQVDTALISELVDGIWVPRASGSIESTFANSKFQEIDGELYAIMSASLVTGQGSTYRSVLKEDPESGVWNAWPIPSLPGTIVSGTQLKKIGNTWYLAASLDGASEVGAVFRRDGDGPWTQLTQYGNAPRLMRDIAQYKDTLFAVGSSTNLSDCQFSSRVYQSDLSGSDGFYALPSRFAEQTPAFNNVQDIDGKLFGHGGGGYAVNMRVASYPLTAVPPGLCNITWGTFAHFDGSDWKNVSERLDGGITSLLQYQNQILAFGAFTRAGSRNISPYVARWADGTWESFSAGLPSSARSAAVHQGQLYATTSGLQFTNTWRFNGTQWVSAATTIMLADVMLMSNGTTLYAFKLPNLYRLLGDLWVNINPPAGMTYSQATVLNGTLHAVFSTNGSETSIKRFENNQWIDVSGVPGSIKSLGWHNGELYAGMSASTTSLLRVYRNNTWVPAVPYIPLRPGLTPSWQSIDGLHSSGDLLHLVGKFNYIGGLTAESWIRFYTGSPRIITQPIPSEVTAGQTGYFSIDPEVHHDPLQTYQWHRNGVAVSNGLTSTGSTITGATTPYLRITNVAAADLGLYTVKITNGCGITESTPGELRFPPPYCPADFDQDGSVTGTDVEAFFLTWETGAPEADINLDGGTDGTDIQAFFTLWEAGGC